MTCQTTAEQLPSGKYRHTCQVCGTVRIVRGAKLVAECPSSEPRLCLPGCQLTKLLALLAIEKQGGCGCEDYANQMDAWGVDGCRERIGEIVEHLREQTEECNAAIRERNKTAETPEPELPFNRRGATWLVKLAIKLAAQQREPSRLERAVLGVAAMLTAK